VGGGRRDAGHAADGRFAAAAAAVLALLAYTIAAALSKNH